MKKLLTLALALLMVLSLTGCGSSEDSDKPGPKKEVEFQLATVEKGVYKNPFLGIGFKFKEAGMHENSQAGGTYRTDVKPEDLEKTVSDGVVMELLCQNYENDSFNKDAFNSIMTIEVTKDIRDMYNPVNIMSFKESQRVESASENYENIEHRQITQVIGDAEFNGFELMFTMSNVITGGERHLFLKKGQYCYYITVISMFFGEELNTQDLIRENLDEILNKYFYEL